MTNSFTFDGYTVRSVTEKDRPFLQLQIDADPFHQGRMTADYFLKLEPGEDAWALEDERGRVIFYFKTATAVRMSIQFTAAEDDTQKIENRVALMKGLRWIEAILIANKFREIIFDTEGVELANFAKRRLGFVEATGLLSRSLGLSQDAPTQPSELATVTTTTKGSEGDGHVRH
jgi:hypothetical protein